MKIIKASKDNKLSVRASLLKEYYKIAIGTEFQVIVNNKLLNGGEVFKRSKYISSLSFLLNI